MKGRDFYENLMIWKYWRYIAVFQLFSGENNSLLIIIELCIALKEKENNKHINKKNSQNRLIHIRAKKALLIIMNYHIYEQSVQHR